MALGTSMDQLKQAAKTVGDRGAAAWAGLRGAQASVPPTTAAPAATTPDVDWSQYDKPPSQRRTASWQQRPATNSFEYDSTKFHVGRDGMLKPNAPIDPTKPMTMPADNVTPAQRLSGAPAQPAAPASKLAKGMRAVGRYGAPVIGAAVEGANTYNDITTPGMTALDKTARVAEGAGRVAGSALGASLGATAGSVVPIAGTALGGAAGGTLGYFAPDAVNWVAKKLGLVDDSNQLASDRAASLRGARASVPVAGAPAAQAPVAQAAAPAQNQDSDALPPPTPRFEQFAAGTPGARGIRAQINSNYVPPSGGGLIMSSNGNATRINPEETVAPAPVNVDPVASGLLANARSAGTPRAQREALTQLGAYQNQQRELGLRVAANQMAMQRFAASNSLDERKLADERVKDFRSQTLDKQFTGADGKPDQQMNDKFANFVRENGPALVQGLDPKDPIASISQLEGQSRDNVVAKLRAEFLTNQNVNASNNSGLAFNPGETNKAISANNVRKSRLSDIDWLGRGAGLRPLYDSLIPGVNDNVVETDVGVVPAVDYIGKGEGAYDRRELLKKKGMR